MPKRKDIDAVFIVGAGPIVIGQATEFDYSGSQACKTLKREGYRIALVNSNPATIMTDPAVADSTYIEPITPRVVARILATERHLHPDEKMVLLPTMGGQTALNTALELDRTGVLKELGIEMIGARVEAIAKAEDREQFRRAMGRIGLETPRAKLVKNDAEATEALNEIGLPLIIRPSFTLGGRGGGIATSVDDYWQKIRYGLSESNLATNGQGSVLVEQSVLGWKEFEMEVVRDKKDNAIIVCAIENIDPMGVHTGDSMTVAPALTLTDKEYQRMRLASLAVLREIGVETGGSNVQFAVNPANGDMVVIEMNPRVSRSSALASKATGFPIAKVAALLAVGYTLDELPNDITGGKIPASFEPSLDYVVVKIPRFNFEKFKGSDDTLTTTMKSVGEVMAIGRHFREAFQKAIGSLETPSANGWQLRDNRGVHDIIRSFDAQAASLPSAVRAQEAQKMLHNLLARPSPNRIFYLADILRAGMPIDMVYQLTHIDKWFLQQIKTIVTQEIHQPNPKDILTKEYLLALKKNGYSDANIVGMVGMDEPAIRHLRKQHGILPVYKRIDTCAGEFPSPTAYLYSTYEGNFFDDDNQLQRGEDEADISTRKKIIILGGGPNRIGQGIEFDYACVHAALTLKERGFETIMINCNPETVSTDYDTADRLYFEPVTAEHVLNVLDRETEKGQVMGVIVQYGGQTPLNLADAIEKAGYLILGTSLESLHKAEDRQAFSQIIDQLQKTQPTLQLNQAPGRSTTDPMILKANQQKNNADKNTWLSVSSEEKRALRKAETHKIAEEIGFPLIVRPSFVLGGRAMEIVYDLDALDGAMEEIVAPTVFIDKYLNDAIEVDVDAIADGEEVLVAGIMQHIEEAGVHSGDSACSLPCFSLSVATVNRLEQQTIALGKAMQVKGLMNIQFAIRRDDKGVDDIFILEMNPRASRTVPFVAKATGYPLAAMGARVMAGEKLRDLPRPLSVAAMQKLPFFSVKEAVFPFDRFIDFKNLGAGAEVVLGPEMRSTGEVMGIARDMETAFFKAQEGAGGSLPLMGAVLLSVKDSDKPALLPLAKQLQTMGFQLVATGGTATFLSDQGVGGITSVKKIKEGSPSVRDLLEQEKIAMVVNTIMGRVSRGDAKIMRGLAVKYHLPYFTTMMGATQAVKAIARAHAHEAASVKEPDVQSLQSYHALLHG